MKGNKLQVNDLVLVTGPSYYDKVKVISVEKGRVTLDNQMVIDHNYNNLVRSQMKAEPWDEEKFDLLHASHIIPKILYSMERNWKSLGDKEKIALSSKLERVMEKFNIQMF